MRGWDVGETCKGTLQ